MNKQVKAGITAIRDFLSGRSNESELAAAEDQETRVEVAAELVAAMSGPNPGDDAGVKNNSTQTDQSASGLPNSKDSKESTAATDVVSAATHESLAEEQGRARQLFVEHGYFDEAVHNLRAANLPAERAAAARALGLVGNPRATAHLIAAMFDEDADVRQAAEEAIHHIENPTTAEKSSSIEANAEPQPLVDTTRTVASVESVNNQAEAVTQAIEPPPAQVAEETVAVAEVPVADAAAIKVSQTAAPLEAVTVDLSPALNAAGDEDELLAQEQSINQSVAQIGQQLSETMAAFKQSEDEVRASIEREAQLRAEAVARRSEEEELQRRAEEDAAARRAEEKEALWAEQAARAKAEAEAQHLADEETNLRLKAASLRLDAAEVARRRADLETARKEAMEASREAEARRDRDEARVRHESEVQRLRNEEETLQQAREDARQQQATLQATRERLAVEIERLKEEQAAAEAAQREEAARLRAEAERRNHEAQEQLRAQMEDLRSAEAEVRRRRSEVEAAREKADVEAQRLLEAQARMRAAEDARADAERERAQLEAEINQQVEAQLQLLEETRRRGQEEHNRLQEELRLQTEKEQQRLSELELSKTKADVESAQRAEKERQILAQIDSLRIADAETRRRIEDAEVRRRATEDAYRLVAEKVQRVEAEAHAREKEEERMLAKLEAERKTVAIEAQSRTEQEKRIREEIAMFRRLEDEQRPLIEKATLELADIEKRLQEGKDRLRVMEEAHAEGTQELATPSEGRINVRAERVLDESAEEAAVVQPRTETVAAVPQSPVVEPTPDLVDLDINEPLSPGATPAIATYLKSVDPYKRAAAVAELARTGLSDAFSRITDCFDDPSPHVRNAAARALRKLEPEHTVDMFNRALETGSAERRQNIGAAIATSGIATEAINNLASSSREESYNALSILFVMAKTGEIEPLVQALAEHKDDDIGKAVSKLLSLSGHQRGGAAGGGSAQ